MAKDFEDDGRTICNMDVDGMPQSVFRLRPKERKIDRAELRSKVIREEPLTKREMRRYTWYSVLAGLTAVGIIGGGTVLFIFLLWLLWR